MTKARSLIDRSAFVAQAVQDDARRAGRCLDADRARVRKANTDHDRQRARVACHQNPFVAAGEVITDILKDEAIRVVERSYPQLAT